MSNRNGTGTKSGFYRVGAEEGPSAWAFVGSRVVAVSVLCGALVTISGAVAAGMKIANTLQRPAIESVARDVVAPIVEKEDTEHARLRVEQSLLLPKSDFSADRALRDARENARDDEIREMRKNFEYIRERLDHMADSRGGNR